MSSAIRMALQLVGFHWDQDSADPIESNGRDILQQPDEELKDKIQELQQGAAKAQEVIRTLQEQVRQAHDTICDLSGKVNTYEAEIVQDRQAATVLNGEIQALQAQIAQLQKVQEEKEGTACALSGRVNALETEIAQDRQVATDLNGEIQALEAQIAQVQKVQAQMEGKACALSGRVETLETQNTQDRETVAPGQSGIQQRSTTSYSKAEEIFYADGRVYTGGWIDDRPQGRGEMRFPNGNHYAGYWNNGLQEGQGTLKDADGEVLYQGQWKQGGRHGKIERIDGVEKYSCIWNCGRLEQLSIQTRAGTCEIHQPPIDELTENVIELLEGATFRGTITWTGGERYAGEFQYHRDFFRPHGRGCKIFKDERKFDGSWQEGVISGQGVLTFKEGQSFEGQFSIDRSNFGELICREREGHPTTLFFLEKGWRYEGSVEQGKGPSGQGKMYRREELLYEGVWSSEHFEKKKEWGLRVDLENPSDAKTILLFPQSNYRYEGTFPKNGRHYYEEQFVTDDEAQANFGPHGEGAEYSGETLVYKGGFFEGLYHEHGERFLPLKGIKKFDGWFKKGLPEGKHGCIDLENGDNVSGTWSNGELDLTKVFWCFANGDKFYGSLKILCDKYVWFKSGTFQFADKSVIENLQWQQGALVNSPKIAEDHPLKAYRSFMSVHRSSSESARIPKLAYFERWD
ncbi:MAG: hypothetical protein JSS61_06540 [Verrucomicrobia bacterium]|nr:hypothetical protein [Verrucomicrobiota bacterium]